MRRIGNAIFWLLTLGIGPKLRIRMRNKVKQHPIRTHYAEMYYGRYNTPDRSVYEAVVQKYFSGNELKFICDSDLWFHHLYFDSEENAKAFCDDVKRAGIPVRDQNVSVVHWGNMLFHHHGYKELGNLAYCHDCEAVRRCYGNREFEEPGCSTCDSPDVTPLSDMKPKEVLKHVEAELEAA